MQLSITFEDSSSSQHSLILQKILGKGKFTVYHAKGVSSDINIALKVFPSNSSSEVHYKTEKNFLSKLQGHKNVITYLPIAQTSLEYNALATEFTKNGDFFDFITQVSMFGDTKLARTYFRQLIQGLEHLHAQQVAHLDLKLENLLLDNNYTLKIFDFDQAQHFEDPDLKSGGTPGYRAPELITRTASNVVALDIYACGVLLYTFMTGLMPFVESKATGISKADKYETFKEENARFWRGKTKETGVVFDADLKELINGMWKHNPEERMTLEEVKRSRWYNREVYNEGELKRVMKDLLNC